MIKIPYLKTLTEYKGMFETACLVLDPAHGEDVPGKRSPDEKHREYLWSRQRIEAILSVLDKAKNKGFDIEVPFKDEINEPGLRTRVNTYNDLANDYDLVIVLSIHNDALKNPPAFWSGPGGFTFFTDRGETMADTVVNFMGDIFKQALPRERFRFDYALSKGETVKDKDREANFTVIHGYGKEPNHVPAKYVGILIENNFMDVGDDLMKLMSPDWNKELEFVYIDTIFRIFREIGMINYINHVTIKP